MAKDLSILFIGTPALFATTSLKAINSLYHLAGIVESAPRGFNKQGLLASLFLRIRRYFQAHSLWRLARQMGLPYFYYTQDDTAGLINFIERIQPNLGCVVSMNHLLPTDVLKMPQLGFINLHPSLLPDLRGPHVWTWLYYYNDSRGGVTLHRLDALEDHGDILKQADFPIFNGMPPDLLVSTSANLGAELLLEGLYEMTEGTLETHPQPFFEHLRRARRIKPTEDLFPYHQWTPAHCYHFLQGARPWYTPFSSRQRLWGCIDWLAIAYETAPQQPGGNDSIRFDRCGFYFSHPAGKIRLHLKINFFRVTLYLCFLLAVINILFNLFFK